MKPLIAANQGSARHYEQTRDISQSGRLQMTLRDGKNAKDKYSKLYTFGRRSFPIWTISGGPLMRVVDSGFQIEEPTAKHRPHLFNRDVHTDDRSVHMVLEPNRNRGTGEQLKDAQLSGSVLLDLKVKSF
ncbi:alkaline phosphatase [Plakobranchus ocellatus]|uniref:Alkaline phosphatase n=1 Tax=Plakobranchus ocellatus TaxID=259542 RepID=A0AAV4AIX5_9GAST|nr:alkaline phosphatase [Plakobranchus ocellatus]